MTEVSGPPGLSVPNSTSSALGRQPSGAPSTIVPPPDGEWIERWISPERLSGYLLPAGGDRVRALALYEWNAQVSVSLQRDLGHVEVALRNAYDRSATAWTGPGHWLLDGAGSLFGPLLRVKRQHHTGQWVKRQVDINSKPRELIAKAVRDGGGVSATPGKVVAELNFGFWRYLSSSAHEKTLWVPFLHRAFRPGASRVYVDSRVGRLYRLRNRTAHHEPLLREDLAEAMVDLFAIAELLEPQLAAHLRATSTVMSLVAARP